MNAIFHFALTNQALVWVLFLLPLVAVFHRGIVQEKRADRFGTPVKYGVMFYLGFVPVVNLPVALYFTAKSVLEFRR